MPSYAYTATPKNIGNVLIPANTGRFSGLFKFENKKMNMQKAPETIKIFEIKDNQDKVSRFLMNENAIK